HFAQAGGELHVGTGRAGLRGGDFLHALVQLRRILAQLCVLLQQLAGELGPRVELLGDGFERVRLTLLAFSGGGERTDEDLCGAGEALFGFGDILEDAGRPLKILLAVERRAPRGVREPGEALEFLVESFGGNDEIGAFLLFVHGGGPGSLLWSEPRHKARPSGVSRRAGALRPIGARYGHSRRPLRGADRDRSAFVETPPPRGAGDRSGPSPRPRRPEFPSIGDRQSGRRGTANRP